MPIQNGRHFADIIKCIFLTENGSITNTIWMKFVPKGPIYNNAALVQAMAWCLIGDEQLPEPTMTQFIVTYMRQYMRHPASMI